MTLSIKTHLVLSYPDDGGTAIILRSGFPDKFIVVTEDPHMGAELRTVGKADLYKLGFTDKQIEML